MLKKLVSEPPKEQIKRQADTTVTESQEIPPKLLFNSDLKELKGFREMRITLKQNLMYCDFVESLSNVLDLFDNTQRKYDHDIVQFVCQSAEDAFISHKQMGLLKKKAVVEICKRYFNDDAELVSKIIEIVLPNIIKSSLYRRNKKRLSNCFFFVVSYLFPSLKK